MGAGRVCTSISGRIVRVIVACAVAGGLTAACAPSDAGRDTTAARSPTQARTADAEGCLVGASWFNLEEETIGMWEDPALQKAILAAKGSYKATNAKSSPESQSADIDGLIAAGAKVIVLQPGDDSAILPAIQRATDAGVAVLVLGRSVGPPRAYPKALYIAFDPVEIGRQEASALLAARPRGNYVIVKGHGAPPFVDLIGAGIQEILQPAVDRGDITIVATVDAPDWDPAYVQQEMTTILNQRGGKVDAVAAEWDGFVYSVQQALTAAGLEGKVAVGGVYDDGAWGLISVSRGTQAVDVWGNPELLSIAAARAAVALCHNPDFTRVDGSAPFTWPGYDPMTAILLTPVAITKDNLSVVIYTSIQWRQQICDYAQPSAAPPACQLGRPSPPVG